MSNPLPDNAVRVPRRALWKLGLGFAAGAALAQLIPPLPPKLPRAGRLPDWVESPWVPPVLPQKKPEGELRVFVVGGSLTYGLPYGIAGQASYARLAEAGLRAVLGRTNLHVRPEAKPALDSEQIATLVERLVAWQPDLIVAVFGANEYINRVIRATAIRPECLLDRISLRIARAQHGFARVFQWAGLESPDQKTTTSAFAKSIRDARPGRPSVPALPVGPRDKVFMENRTRAQMRRMAVACRAAGTKLVFALSVHGYEVLSPWCNETRPTSQALDEFVARVFASPEAVKLEDVQAWIARYPERADLRYARALMLRRAGEGSEALKSFERALDLDLAPIHRTTGLQKAVVEEASALGVRLLDFNRVFADQFGITGPEHFLDYAHVDLIGQVAIAKYLVRKLSGRELPQLPEGFEARFEKAAWQWLDATVPESVRKVAPALMARNDAIYYLLLGNFRDASRCLKAALAVSDDAATRADYEFCRKHLETLWR